MEYKLTVNDETVPVDVETAGDNSLSVTIGDNAQQILFSTINEHHIRLDIDGRSINAYVAGTSDDKWIVINGTSYKVADADVLENKGPRKSRAGKTPDIVTPPMPATVVKVMVEQGEAVEAGQPVVVVSAMKMESTLGAPHAGTVTKINTSEGSKVMPGEILVDIEKQGED